MILNFILNHLLIIAIALLILFSASIILNKKIFALIASFSFVSLSVLLFVSGIYTVGGFEGMGVSLAGILYFIIGLVTFFITLLVIYLQNRKRVKELKN